MSLHPSRHRGHVGLVLLTQAFMVQRDPKWNNKAAIRCTLLPSTSCAARQAMAPVARSCMLAACECSQYQALTCLHRILSAACLPLWVPEVDRQPDLPSRALRPCTLAP